jgi:glycosyltransferase involved in cell wall biosynthesis
MKLLIFGHYSHTGFGVVTEALGAEFIARGIDVRVLAVNHRGEPVRGALAGRVWPAAMFGDAFGGNLSSKAIDGSLWRQLHGDDDWKPDQVLVISDMSGFQGHIGQKVTEQWLSLPVWHYCPIEGDNLPVSWRDVWNRPGGAESRTPFWPVAMSDYGARVISEHLGRGVPRIYHGVDSATFRPVSAAEPLAYKGKWLRSKDDCKTALGFRVTDKVILRTDRHVPRKFYHTLFQAMEPVFADDPNAVLVIHCRPQDEGGNLLEEIARLPKDYWSRVKLTQAHDTWRGLPTEELVVLMNAADLYVSTTSGEGFGLTLAESLACEVPVVTTDWAAGPEVIGPGGIVVAPLHDQYGEVVRYHSTYGMDWAVPDARGFVDPIRTLLDRPQRRRQMGEAGRRHVARSFRWSDAADQFVALFETALPSEVAA